MNPDEIVGRAGIAQMLGVGVKTALRYTHRPDFPAPAGQLGHGRVWYRSAVEEWARATLPLKHDPRKSTREQ